MTELEIEAEKYSSGYFNPEKVAVATNAFIAGATSSYVEKQKLQFAIECLEEETFGRGGLDRDEYKARIIEKLETRLNQLK